MIRYSYIWSQHSLEDYLLDVLKYPSDTHVYNCGPEYEFGLIHNNSSEYSKYHKDPEFLDTLDKVTQLCESLPELKKRMILIRGDHSKVDNITGLKDFSHLFGEIHSVWNYLWWHNLTKFQQQAHNQTLSVHTPPHKLFVCLQNRPHPHRYNVAKVMIDTGLIDRGTCSWCISDNSEATFQHNASLQCPDHLEAHRLISENLDRFQNPECTRDLSSWIANYQDYLFDIVSESANHVHFFTEKSFKPIFHGKPFVILGSPGQNNILRGQGYEIFDDIFDLTSDSDLDMDDTRYTEATTNHYKKIINPLCDITDSDIPVIYQSVKPKVIHNHSVMVKQFFDHELPEAMLDPVLNDIGTYNVNVTPEVIKTCQAWFKNNEYFSQFVPR